MTDQPHKEARKAVSLRDVAKKLGCSHSSLSEQIHRGDLTLGVVIREGRIVVTDPVALMAEWNGAPAARVASAIVLRDVDLDCEVTAAQLFAERNALSLLVTALTLDALAERSAEQVKRRISPRLREAAPLHGANGARIARAWDEFKSALELAALTDEEAEDAP